ncbi:hypothetical protein [Streptomyces californicus]
MSEVRVEQVEGGRRVAVYTPYNEACRAQRVRLPDRSTDIDALLEGQK